MEFNRLCGGSMR